jgi:5-methylcytosine-specific restriction endonuclease McrA
MTFATKSSNVGASKLLTGGKMTETQLHRIWEKTKGHCHFCGDPVEFEKRGWIDGDLSGYWEIDHIIQKGKGGSHAL